MKALMNRTKGLLADYRALSIMGVYMVVYLAAFYFLEKRDVAYHVIHFGIDAYIPFCEYFIIPYLLWFVYVSATVVLLGIKDKEEGAKLVAFLIAGMTIFIVVSAIFPNGLNIRPRYFTRDNIFIDMVKWLYSIDTSTNVVPSIHVYNTLGVMIAVLRSRLFCGRPIVKTGMLLLGVSIICSTVLIKQHSMLDVLTATILSALIYALCYRNESQPKESLSEEGAKIHF